MGVPTRVQSSAGTVATTGTQTVSLTGCTAGNVVLFHVAERGTIAEDFSTTNRVNIEAIDGVDGNMDAIVTGSSAGAVLHQAFIGRVIANGTVSVDMTVGASGNDLYAWLHEFSGCSTSSVAIGSGGVFENGSILTGRDVAGGTSATPFFAGATIITNGTNRLGITLASIASAQAMSSWTLETGGDFTEAAEFQSATGATATLQLQTASLPSPTTVADGEQSLGVSTDWVVVLFALNGTPDPTIITMNYAVNF